MIFKKMFTTYFQNESMRKVIFNFKVFIFKFYQKSTYKKLGIFKVQK